MTAQDTMTQIESGLSKAEEAMPMLSGILMMIPGAQAIVPFLQLIPVLIEAVQTIMKATGSSQTGAITAVRSHLTQGMPNSPALSQGGGSFNTGS